MISQLRMRTFRNKSGCRSIGSRAWVGSEEGNLLSMNAFISGKANERSLMALCSSIVESNELVSLTFVNWIYRLETLTVHPNLTMSFAYSSFKDDCMVFRNSDK